MQVATKVRLGEKKTINCRAWKLVGHDRVMLFAGWLLIFPPITEYDHKGKADVDASLRIELDKVRAGAYSPPQCDQKTLPHLMYPSKGECEEERKKALKKEGELWRLARCVPADELCRRGKLPAGRKIPGLP